MEVARRIEVLEELLELGLDLGRGDVEELLEVQEPNDPSTSTTR